MKRKLPTEWATVDITMNDDTIQMSVSAEELQEFPEFDDDKQDEFEVYFKKTHIRALMPRKGSEQATGYDLFTCAKGIIPAHETRLINTGIKMKIACRNTCAKIMSRSGLKYHHKVGVVSSPSIIDRDFRGTIEIPMYNDSDKDFYYWEGERIAQMTFEQYHNVKFVELKEEAPFPGNEEPAEKRGSFGSTGTGRKKRRYDKRKLSLLLY